MTKILSYKNRSTPIRAVWEYGISEISFLLAAALFSSLLLISSNSLFSHTKILRDQLRSFRTARDAVSQALEKLSALSITKGMNCTYGSKKTGAINRSVHLCYQGFGQDSAKVNLEQIFKEALECPQAKINGEQSRKSVFLCSDSELTKFRLPVFNGDLMANTLDLSSTAIQLIAAKGSLNLTQMIVSNDLDIISLGHVSIGSLAATDSKEIKISIYAPLGVANISAIKGSFRIFSNAVQTTLPKNIVTEKWSPASSLPIQPITLYGLFSEALKVALP